DIWFSPAGLASGGGKVAFLFPGVEPTFGAEATDLPALGRVIGLAVPPISVDTVAHQSASIYRLGVFLAQAARRAGIEPDMVAGHSVGEWAGTVAAGMVPLDRAEELVGGHDLDAVELPDLDFVAVGAGAAAAAAVVEGVEGVVVSHDNCPGQSVLCAWPSVVDDVLARLRAANILGYRLPFQSGFHTPAIAEALESIRDLVHLLPMGPGDVPMWSSTLVAPYPDTRDEILDLHLRHLVEPVRFRPTIERMYHEAGARIFVQIGLGTLTAFVDDTLSAVDHVAVPLLSAKRSALAQVHRALTALWVEGVPVRPDVLDGDAPATPTTATPVATTAAAPATAPPPTAPATATATTARRTAGEGSAADPVAVAEVARPDAGHTAAPPRPAAQAPHPGTPGSPAAAGPPHALAVAADMLAAAATAGQQVIEALAARLAGTAARPSAPVPLPAARNLAPAATAAPAAQVPTPDTPAAPPAPAAPAAAGGDWPTGKVVVRRHLSLDTMPETLDHTLYEQPEGWPDPSDRFPIVAMTTQIDLLRDVARSFGGGRDVVEVFGVRNFRWLDLSEPVDVDITVVPRGDDVLNLSLGSYCKVNVRLGRFPTPPRHERRPLVNVRPSTHTAEEMFAQRLMFHGPRFRGVAALGPVGDDGMLGEFEHLDTPGSLLDNLGKLIAYWVIDRRGIGEGALPTGVTRIEFFGREPTPGVPVHCDIRIDELQRDQVRADGVLVLPDGTVWCRVEGWTSLVFHLDEVMEPLYHDPPRHYVTEAQPGGWYVARERWPTGPARDLTARRFLSRPEREVYEGLNLLAQRRWLIDMAVAKDAARHWLGEHHGIRCFPVELRPVADGERRYRIVGGPVPEGCDLRVTVSGVDWAAVAVVAEGEYHDIEARVVDDPDDAGSLAAEAAAALADRNPGAPVEHVTRPPNEVSSILDPTGGQHLAVAWTAAPVAAAR
ncbi:MAG TPA: acyltransferase domain-containing protein, partial [Acidimicrobiales bacterium]|nr:acyltransferase domain-containing protein [Acidimicrobiales bacterium]